MTLAMSGATPSDSGLASGLVNTTVQVGGAIGLAVLATLATARTGDATDGARRALNSGYHLAYLIGAALMGVAVLVALVVLRSDAAPACEPATAAAVASAEPPPPDAARAWCASRRIAPPLLAGPSTEQCGSRTA